MIDALDWKQCVLCKGCAQICPVNAITFSEKHYDFLYPVIQSNKCISCDLCSKKCAVLNPMPAPPSISVGYAAKNIDENIRLNSTSGGVFFELAKATIAKGGFVVGVVFDEGFRARFEMTNSLDAVKSMCGSKYVQADTVEVFQEIRTLLSQQKMVLFGACPCQIAALRSFLGEDDENLLLCDIVCHGVPSERFLQEYIHLHEKRKKSRVKEIFFRDKQFGWHLSSVKILFHDGSIYIRPIIADAYMKGFLNGTALKESCYQCRFKNHKSGSDITLCDFWGAEKELMDYDDNKGISGVWIHTEKGMQMFRDLNLEFIPVSTDQIKKYNKNYEKPTVKNLDREAFFDHVGRNGYESAIETFLWEKRSTEIKRKLKFRFRCLKAALLHKRRPLY